MTTADPTGTVSGDGEIASRSGAPLLHLRGTEYGLLIHGLRMAAEGRHGGGTGGGADQELGGCDHG
ncbi:MAG: hypothetical protein QOF96_1468 [Actinomycetota bacterium]|nr:hypothetical protein [Actinomycetota bacterium]